MKFIKWMTIGAALMVAAVGTAQGWSDAYQKALNALKTERWTEARTFFRQAASLRAEDFSGPTSVRTAAGSTAQWRDGASYSPNFGAAYSGYRFALKISDENERTAMLRTVSSELQSLIAKNQGSKEAFYFLNNTYAFLRDSSAQQKLAAKKKAADSGTAWIVDAEILTIEDRAAVDGNLVEPVAVAKPSNRAAETTKAGQPTSDTPPNPEKVAKPKDAPKNPIAETKQDGGNPTQDNAKPKPVEKKDQPKKEDPPKTQDKPKEDKPQTPITNPTDETAVPVKPRVSDPNKPAKPNEAFVRAGAITPESFGPVVQVSNKFALIIGNATSGIPDSNLDFASTDSEIVKNSLVRHGGYPEANVSVLTNVTADQMLDAARALAERVGEDGIVVIYFSGVGSHLDGKDFLAGVNTQMATDSSTMVAKTSLYQVFMSKGARIFAFFQANRPIIGGKAFGDEVPQVGAIAQMQATMRGATVTSLIRDGQPVGLFTNAVGQTFNDLRSNKIPILEFAWQVFDRIRRGNSGSSGGAATQVPTLPVLTNLAQDARF